MTDARTVIDAIKYTYDDDMCMSVETTIGETFGAEVILAALADAGLKVVAREPTPEMYKASLHEATGINTPHWGPWEQMWDAAEPKTVREGSE
jgi:hypothetical protein